MKLDYNKAVADGLNLFIESPSHYKYNLFDIDTYLMLPNEKADFLFVADNPGQWLFHCHMLEHHASGMGGVIKIM